MSHQQMHPFFPSDQFSSIAEPGEEQELPPSPCSSQDEAHANIACAPAIPLYAGAEVTDRAGSGEYFEKPVPDILERSLDVIPESLSRVRVQPKLEAAVRDEDHLPLSEDKTEQETKATPEMIPPHGPADKVSDYLSRTEDIPQLAHFNDTANHSFDDLYESTSIKNENAKGEDNHAITQGYVSPRMQIPLVLRRSSNRSLTHIRRSKSLDFFPSTTTWIRGTTPTSTNTQFQTVHASSLQHLPTSTCSHDKEIKLDLHKLTLLKSSSITKETQSGPHSTKEPFSKSTETESGSGSPRLWKMLPRTFQATHIATYRDYSQSDTEPSKKRSKPRKNKLQTAIASWKNKDGSHRNITVHTQFDTPVSYLQSRFAIPFLSCSCSR